MENLFEQIMKENFPNLAKEIDFQEVQEAQRVPKKLDPRRNTPRHIISTLAKIKDTERILEAAREKDTLTYKGVPIRLSADFSKETLLNNISLYEYSTFYLSIYQFKFLLIASTLSYYEYCIIFLCEPLFSFILG